MRIDISFAIINRELNLNEICTEAFVSDQGIYHAIQDIAFEHWGAPLPRRSYLTIKVAADDPHVNEVFTLLAKAGWSPYYGPFLPENLRFTHFKVKRYRCYETRDRDECEYLHIHRWGTGDPVFQFDSIRDGLYCGKTAGAKWKTRYGLTYNCEKSPRFVNAEMKHELEAQGLVGLAFQRVIFDKPAKARGEFWQLTSSITMPPCLLPLISIPSTPHPVVEYDDGGYFPKELVFDRAAVGQVEPFDIAITREDVDCRPNAWCRELIVSQRFRQAIHKLKMSTVELVPVRLRD